MDNVKKYITSLLTSTPLAMTMQQLNKDYRNTIGECIPYQKLGFNSLEHLLRSIPETVRLNGSGPMAQVLPVISQRSAHVMELVSSQKKSIPKRRSGYFGPRKVIFTPPSSDNRKQFFQAPVEEKPKKIHYPVRLSDSSFEINERPGCNNNNFDEKPVPENYLKTSNLREALPTPEKEQRKVAYDSNGVSDDTKVFMSREYEKSLDERPRSSDKYTKKKSHHSDRSKPPSDDLENSIPQSIQYNLKMLIKQYPDGIWCANVPVVYRQMFRKELKYQELGFRSLIDLCISLKSIFHYVRPSTEDFKLYDRSKPLPMSAERNFTIASYGNSSSGKSDAESGAALPNIDWEDMASFLPRGTFKPGSEIPRAFIPEMTSENDCIYIKVGEIYDPSKFWIYIDDGALDNLMDEMQVFYNENAAEYLMPQHLMHEGHYCVQLIFGEYHRALIVDTLPSVEDMIRVVFIDYGTVAKVSSKNLCFLHEDFAKLPAQTIRCRLANICPPEKGEQWSRESSRVFRELILKKQLKAKIVRINWTDQYLEVYIADVTDENNVFYINDYLVEKGYAVHHNQEQKQSILNPISTPVVSLIHLFPTYLEIENGLAPSTLEMEVFHDSNVPINFCYPQYFKSDTKEEEKLIESSVSFYETYCVEKTRFQQKYFMDRSKLNATSMDLSVFGELECDVRPFFVDEIPNSAQDEEISDVSKENAASNSYLDDIAVISKRIENLKTQTVDELRKDCLLSEDIMNDILSICGNNEYSNQNDETTSNEPLSIKEERLTNSFLESISDRHIDEYLEDSSEEPIEVDQDLDSKEFLLANDDLESPDVVSRNPHPESDDVKPFSFSKTNPFLQDINTTGDAENKPSLDNFKLHPSNPFLTYVKPKVDDQHLDVSEASNSTVYDCIKGMKLQKWSTNDDKSSDITSSYSNSSDSLKGSENLQGGTISTQTSNGSARNVQNYPSGFSLPTPTVGAFPNIPVDMMNPYYATMPNYGYLMQPQYCPPPPTMHHFMPPRPAPCPPPGFAPRPHFHHGFPMNQPSMPYGLFRPTNMPPFQYNSVSRTAMSVSCDRDFYEAYNAKLKLKIQHEAKK